MCRMSSDAQQLRVAPDRGPTGPAWWEKPGLLELALVCVAAIIFIATLSFGFVYDDRVQVLDNPFLQSWRYLGHDFTSHVWAQTHKPAVYYRPMFLVWLRLNYTLFGTRAWGWHLMTVLAHALATLLVFRLASRILGNRWQAAVAGLIFATHPVHVENVAWVSGAVDPLLCLFFLGSLLCYLRWRERRSSVVMIASWALAFLAMLTKEPGLTLPAVIFAYAWLFAGGEAPAPISAWRRSLQAVAHAAPFAAVAVVYWSMRHAVVTAPPFVTSYATVLLTLPGLLLFYLRLLIWPVGLSLFYAREFVHALTFTGFVLPLLGVAAMAAGAWAFFRRDPQRRQAMFSAAFMLITLSPALWIRWFRGDDFVHDRYLYIPCVGFAMVLAIAVERLQGKQVAGSIAPPRQLAVVGVAVLALIVATGITQMNWADDLLLWFHCYQHAPHNPRVLNNLASSLGERGEFGRAVPLFQEVLQKDPDNAEAQGNLGYTYYQMGALRQAEEHLAHAVQLDPYDSHSALYLGFTLYKLGAVPAAREALSRAIQLDPSATGAHLALGLVLEQLGDVAGAIRELRSELAFHPQEKEARQRLEQLQRGR